MFLAHEEVVFTLVVVFVELAPDGWGNSTAIRFPILRTMAVRVFGGTLFTFVVVFKGLLSIFQRLYGKLGTILRVAVG